MRVILPLSLLAIFSIGCTTSPKLCQPVPDHMTDMPPEPACNLGDDATNADVNRCILKAERDRLTARAKLRAVDIHQSPCR